jgi:hypothetical protein
MTTDAVEAVPGDEAEAEEEKLAKIHCLKPNRATLPEIKTGTDVIRQVLAARNKKFNIAPWPETCPSPRPRSRPSPSAAPPSRPRSSRP